MDVFIKTKRYCVFLVSNVFMGKMFRLVLYSLGYEIQLLMLQNRRSELQ